MEIPSNIGANLQQDDGYQDDDIISALMGDGEYSDDEVKDDKGHTNINSLVTNPSHLD